MNMFYLPSRPLTFDDLEGHSLNVLFHMLRSLKLCNINVKISVMRGWIENFACILIIIIMSLTLNS